MNENAERDMKFCLFEKKMPDIKASSRMVIVNSSTDSIFKYEVQFETHYLWNKAS